MRCNRDEFLSYLGTCFNFYNMHLTSYERKHSINEISDIIKEYMSPDDCDRLSKALQGEKIIYHDTDSVKEVSTDGNDPI